MNRIKGRPNWGKNFTFGDNFTDCSGNVVPLSYPLKIKVIIRKISGEQFTNDEIVEARESLMYYGSTESHPSGKTDIDYEKYSGINLNWMKNTVENYKAFEKEISADSSKIPIVAISDLHGIITADSQVFNFINDVVNWDKVSKYIYFGDIVSNVYTESVLQDYSTAVKNIPSKKRIELGGNHDFLAGPEYSVVSSHFSKEGAVKSSDGRAFVVEDKQYNVRYLAVDAMYNPRTTGKSGKMCSEQAEFIISELEKADASNIVLISHTYLFKDNIIARDGTTFSGADYFIGSDTDTAVKDDFVKMLSDRKAKKSGVFVDSDGKEHPYDFTKCKGQLLMSLHGHHHREGYLTSNGLTEFLFQSFRYNGSKQNETNCFYFAYIDVKNKKFKCWKNYSGYDAWEISIA